MSAYFFLDVLEITDEETMAEYRSRVFAIVEKYGGRYLIVGGDQQPLEGQSQLTFPVLIEFDNLEAANRWYDSDDYRELKKMRLAATRGNAFLIGGFQPATVTSH